MTVAELIERLESMPKHIKVIYTEGDSGSYSQMNYPEVKVMEILNEYDEIEEVAFCSFYMPV